MIIVSYDISNNKTRRHFSKFLEHYGIRLQYSVFEINHSKRVLDIVINKIESKFSPLFKMTDSVLIFKTDEKEVIKYGNAIHRDKPLVII